MRPEYAIGLAIFALEKKKGGATIGLRRDIVKEVQHLKNQGIVVAGVRIRPSLEGPSSEEISDFVGRLAMTGHLRQESPIRLTDEGRELIRTQIQKGFQNDSEREEITRALSLLGLSPEVISSHQVVLAI
ncbi:MAG TPA: hypothetical protein VGO40_09785 [Longimicrobium sp.]|jgi:hypothetical protein|nr:hypothetical protein [Longimicrobium sp.]